MTVRARFERMAAEVGLTYDELVGLEALAYLARRRTLWSCMADWVDGLVWRGWAR